MKYTNEAPPTTSRIESPYLTKQEAAAYARCSIRTIERYFVRGILTRHGVGARALIHLDELASALAKKTQAGM